MMVLSKVGDQVVGNSEQRSFQMKDGDGQRYPIGDRSPVVTPTESASEHEEIEAM